jgi:hypothetical protein
MSDVNKSEEYKLFVDDTAEGLNFSDREAMLPGLFIALYALYGVVLLGALGLQILRAWLKLVGLS